MIKLLLGHRRLIGLCIALLVVRLATRALVTEAPGHSLHTNPKWPPTVADAYREPPKDHADPVPRARKVPERRSAPQSGKVLSGPDVTAILKGAQWPDEAVERYRFRPGTLQLNTTEAFRHCHVDPKHYEMHFLHRAGKIGIEVSHEHKLIYIMLAKSGSSTGKVVMKQIFGSHEEAGFAPDLNPHGTSTKYKGYLKLTFVRDPVSRFFSSYEEMFVRTFKWETKARTGTLPNKFKFIHEGINSYQDYEDIFCPPETRPKRGNVHLQCNQVPSRENGTLVARFERFAQLWDGVYPFDVHLKLQAPLLSDITTGDPFPIDVIYNTTVAAKGWREVATSKGLAFPKELKKARGYPRRLNLTKVTDAAKLRICKIVTVDNCCFNLPLPDVCAQNDAADSFCALERRPGGDHRVKPWTPIGTAA